MLLNGKCYTVEQYISQGLFIYEYAQMPEMFLITGIEGEMSLVPLLHLHMLTSPVAHP